VVVRGRSGSGKTTLLNMLGGLDDPTTGTVELDGENLTSMDEATKAQVRRKKVGFIFQAFGLIPILTAVENVEIPLRLTKTGAETRRKRSRELLDLVGLADRIDHRPEELSGGEQQRVAIARALANEPRLLLADEPTGQLDSRTGRVIVDLIINLVHSENIAAIVATHDPAPLAIADRVIELSDGEVTSDTR
jgi:putative ABC transport system ATP-binding protein